MVRADRLTDKLADRQTLLLVYVDVQPVQEESPGTYKTKAEAKKNQIENDSYQLRYNYSHSLPRDRSNCLEASAAANLI